MNEHNRELKPRHENHRNQAQVTKSQFKYGIAPLPEGLAMDYEAGTRLEFLNDQLKVFFALHPGGVATRGPIIKEWLSPGHAVREYLCYYGYAARYGDDGPVLEAKLQGAISGFLSMMVKQHLYDNYRGVYKGCAVWVNPVQIRGEPITVPLMPVIPGWEDETGLDAAIAAEEEFAEQDEPAEAEEEA